MTTDNSTAPVQGLTDEQIDAIAAPWLAPDGQANDSDVRQIVRAALAAAPHTAAPVVQPVVPAGWRPIETAPRDGTDILLTNGKDVAEGHWMHEEPYVRERRDAYGRYIGQDESDGFDGWIDWSGGMRPEPTRWMPLPAAPASLIEQGRAAALRGLEIFATQVTQASAPQVVERGLGPLWPNGDRGRGDLPPDDDGYAPTQASAPSVQGGPGERVLRDFLTILPKDLGSTRRIELRDALQRLLHQGAFAKASAPQVVEPEKPFANFQRAWRVAAEGNDAAQARAEASAPSVQVPGGWKLVPVEPTEEMLAACRGVEPLRAFPAGTSLSEADAANNKLFYRAMLAAAPEASALPAAQQPAVEPVAWLKEWWSAGSYLSRVDQHDRLDAWMPRSTKVTPLGPLASPTAQPAAPDVVADARRYRLLRRGQHFGVVDGAGDELHAEALDAAIDAELDREGPKT